MKTAFMLFLLTASPNGDLSSAYSAYADKEECEGALLAVSSIFDAQGVKTAYRGCLKSEQTFTPFKHNVPADAPSYVTLNHIEGDHLSVQFVEDLKSCQQSQKVKGDQSWCASTFQSKQD